MFSGGVKRDQWHEMVNKDNKNSLHFWMMTIQIHKNSKRKVWEMPIPSIKKSTLLF